METLVLLDLPVGFYRNGTTYQGKNRWIDGHLFRFHEGAWRPIGGWTPVTDASQVTITATGKPRETLAFRKNDRSAWLALGTTGSTSKLYAFSAGVLNDLTPGGLTAGSADGTVDTGTGINYGSGLFGTSLYGSSSVAGTIVDADTWSLDNFGEILLACLTSDGKLWNSTPAAVATQISGSPSNCRALVVTPERFLFALGAGGDPRLVQWASQQTLTTWTAASSNSAGSFPLQTSGRLIAGRRTDRETLLWTDTDLWSAVYIGGTLIYSFQRRGDNCGLIGPNSVCVLHGVAYWVADGRFFMYDGAVREIPCEVADYVWSDLNKAQRAKIAAVPSAQFGEVTWYYPSATQGGTENDRYVTLKVDGLKWWTGNLGRNSGVGTGVFANPQKWGSDGKLYSHESGFNHDGQIGFLESGPLELDNGDHVARVQYLIPDEDTLGEVKATIYSAFHPMEAESQSGPYTLAAQTNVRATGRQFRIRLDETVGSTDLRIGNFRAGVIPGGRR